MFWKLTYRHANSIPDGEISPELYMKLTQPVIWIPGCSFPIVLQQGIRICQIVFVQMSESAEQPYRGKYNGQAGATPSRLEVDPEFSKSG